jgi:hypothetical protein
MRKLLKAAPFVVLCVLIAGAPSARAYWVQNGVALCAQAVDQMDPRSAPDGAGGAIVTWGDLRNGNYDIYAQRVDASGAPQWTADGVVICTAMNDQLDPMIVADGMGGAIVTWYDYRSGTNYDIYAQRVDASGVAQWTANGVAVCAAANDQLSPVLIADGTGGAIVAWYDYRSGTNYDIWAQRVNASGAVQWSPGIYGQAICTATGNQAFPVIVSDGADGAIIAWLDRRSGTDYDIYAQRVNGWGGYYWTANGASVCAATGEQQFLAIASDDAGGAIMTWSDVRSGTSYDVYAQRFSAAGAAQWTANGVALASGAGNQAYSTIAPDGAGGAVVAWENNSAGNKDIYAQKVNASGVAQWTANGAALCTALGDQTTPETISDDAGGAIVAWTDARSGGLHIYAQRASGSGVAQWAANGIPVCVAALDQQDQTIVSDGVGGAVMAWRDYRNGNNDVYAQSIDGEGRAGLLAPVIHSILDVPGDQGGCVNLAWDASRADYFTGDITQYTIWRSLSTPAALMMIENGAALLSGPEQISSTTRTPQVRMEQLGGQTFYWSLIDSHDAYYLQNYSKIVETAFDSSSATTQYSYFQIIAHTSDPRTFFVSAPDSGRSVDNIAPCPPAGLAGEQSYTPAGLDLTWHRNTEPDLGHYAVYRGTSADFVPGPGNLVAAPCDTTLFDGDWRWDESYYYKVSAIDVHGNESGFALLSPDGVTGTDTPKAPDASYLAQNYPNPFNPATRISFGLSAPSRVSLRIYDTSGRLVRTLVEGERGAGRFTELWDGRDSGGRAVASGIYFYRLSAGGFERTKKMILLR